MKIGIDAYPLFSKENTGIGNVIISVIEELSAHDAKNEYYLYTPGITHQDIAERITAGKRVNIRIVKGFFKNVRKIWLQSPQLISQMKKDNIDLFWGGGEYIPLFTPQKITAVATIHDVVFKLFPETVSLSNMLFYKTLLPLCLKRADRCLTVSKTSGKEIADLLGFPKERIDVIYNAIDTTVYRPKKSAPIKKKHFLFVGTLQPRKNLINVIKAFAALPESSGIPLIIIGASGWKQSAMKDIIADLPERIRRNIIFKGYISRSELVKFYQEAFCLINPSLHEGFGLCIAEAMAAGTAVISSRTGAIPEVFGSSLIYADPLSPGQIARAMTVLSTDVRTRKTYEAKGTKLAAKFDIENTSKSYLKYFQKIIPKKRK